MYQRYQNRPEGRCAAASSSWRQTSAGPGLDGGDRGVATARELTGVFRHRNGKVDRGRRHAVPLGMAWAAAR